MVNTRFDFKDVKLDDAEFLMQKLEYIMGSIRAYKRYTKGLDDIGYTKRDDDTHYFLDEFNKTIEQYVRGELKKPSAFTKINDDDDDFI